MDRKRATPLLDEVMGQCRRCGELMALDVRFALDRRGADIRSAGVLYQFVPQRKVSLQHRSFRVPPDPTIHTGKRLIHSCGGDVTLLGGFMPSSYDENAEDYYRVPSLSTRDALSS